MRKVLTQCFYLRRDDKLNETSIAHFKEHFPNENTDKFDKIYFTKASDNDFAFICVQGAMEDFKVFVKGNFYSHC